jgi:hypothetical protein
MNCLHCNAITKNAKYCSRKCAATVNGKVFAKRKTKKVCIICGEKVMSWRHNRCRVHNAEYREHAAVSFRNHTIEEYINRPSVKNKHPSWKNSHIRAFANSWHKTLKRQPCKNCGYSKHVELAHIKGVSSFPKTATLGEVNHSNNLLPLCPNCHWEFDNGHLTLEKIMVGTEGIEPPFSTPVTATSLED